MRAMDHAGAVVIAVSAITGRGDKEGWLPEDLNNGRLDLFFVFLAGEPSRDAICL